MFLPYITVTQSHHPNRVSRGVDFEAAKELGINVIWALSLPGKIAPYTSGKILKDTITNIFNELYE